MAGQVDTHTEAPVQWSSGRGVRANRLCLPHSPWPGYMPHIIARPWAGSSTLQVPGYMEVVNLGDTSHRTDGTKVLTYLLFDILQ